MTREERVAEIQNELQQPLCGGWTTPELAKVMKTFNFRLSIAETKIDELFEKFHARLSSLESKMSDVAAFIKDNS